MSIAISSLAAVQLPSTKGSIYAGSTTKSTVVKNIILTNTSTTVTQTINIYLKQGGGSSRLISPLDMQLPPKAQVILDSEITLAVTATVADILEGATTTGSTVDCVINGMTRDL